MKDTIDGWTCMPIDTCTVICDDIEEVGHIPIPMSDVMCDGIYEADHILIDTCAVI